MKKLMFAAAAIAAGVAVADVTSANIVGYKQEVTDGVNPYPIIGLSFMPVGGGVAHLSDFVPADGTWHPDDDNLQLINAESLDADEVYRYCDKTTADDISVSEYGEPGHCDNLIGWWDAWDDIGAEGAERGDREVTPGYGYMGYFMNFSPISLTSSGEVPTATTTLTTDGISPYPIIVNYVPRDGMTLADVTPVDGTWHPDDDNLQLINAESLDADEVYRYCDKTTADDISVSEYGEPGLCDNLIGWWDAWDDIGAEGAERGDRPFPVGGGFMGYFMNYSPITLQFKGALE